MSPLSRITHTHTFTHTYLNTRRKWKKTWVRRKHALRSTVHHRTVVVIICKNVNSWIFTFHQCKNNIQCDKSHFQSVVVAAVKCCAGLLSVITTFLLQIAEIHAVNLFFTYNYERNLPIRGQNYSKSTSQQWLRCTECVWFLTCGLAEVKQRGWHASTVKSCNQTGATWGEGYRYACGWAVTS